MSRRDAKPYRGATSQRVRFQDSALKPPKAPERPLVPYMRFSRKMWAKVRADHPDAQLWDIGKVIGQMWRDTPDSEKITFQQEYETEKIEYEKAMKAYQASPAYQQYLATSKRQKQANEKAALNRSRMTETGNVVIQPVDEDEYNNDLTVRKLQQLRFDRNNRLVSELFAPIMAPDTRTIVSQSRLDMLRKQASSLESHQKKLQDELIMLDEKHNAKKADIKEKSDRFTEMMKKVCADRPVYDEPFYQRKVAEWDQKIMSAYADFLKQQEATQAELAAKRARQENSTLFKMVATNEETTNIDSILMPPPPLPAPRDQAP